jgi:hypothetical protein
MSSGVAKGNEYRHLRVGMPYSGAPILIYNNTTLLVGGGY